MDLSPVHREALQRVADAPDGYLIVPNDDPDAAVLDQLKLMGCVWKQLAGCQCDPMFGVTIFGRKCLAAGD